MIKGMYRYTNQLLALNACKPQPGEETSKAKGGVTTPLSAAVWAVGLTEHPNPTFVEYIIKGLREGFRVGFNRVSTLKSAMSNLSVPHPEVIMEYIGREVSLNRMYSTPLPEGLLHISPMGMIPKKNRPGKWRLIVDLSSPKGKSVNDGISPELASVQYSSVDHLASLVRQSKRGALLVKADIKEAYRNIPVHPDDHHLLGIKWEGVAYMDTVLPFGLRSAPLIFSAMADAAQWMLWRGGVCKSLHYLDDFIMVEDSTPRAEDSKQALCRLFETLGIPLEPSKLEGPSSCLTFLGIEVDTINQQLRLPGKKLDRLLAELEVARGRRTMFKRELQSLTGLLQHASSVVRPGRAFLQRLYALQGVGSSPRHNIRLNTAARADIIWWHVFVTRWNGVSLLQDPKTAVPDIKVYSDASGNWGAGAVWLPLWFHFQWPQDLAPLSIQVKELVPVVAAAALYGREWRGRWVEFVVDNRAVVDIINNTHSKESHLMHLIRLLVFLACHYDFWFKAAHIPGKENILADALSRNNVSYFMSQVPQASIQPTQIPLPLLTLLSLDLPWTSTPWMELFKRSLRLV